MFKKLADRKNQYYLQKVSHPDKESLVTERWQI